MAELLLGPLLRHVGTADATVWVETDAPCEVSVLGRGARTFEVEGHHYAIVILRDLAPGAHAYEVTLDGKAVWPKRPTDFPPSLIRTLDTEVFRLAFGSCRVSAPAGKHGPDALQALAMQMAASAPAVWPHALLMLGDQVYADEVPPRTRAFIEARRPSDFPHGDEVGDFEEYTHLYREAWSEPAVRWLLANVPSSMIWDDHDVHDDWNISWPWLERMRALPHWRERIAGAVMSYWLYQHLGNLSPAELEAHDLLARVRASGDGAPLRAYARELAEHGCGGDWSYRRRFDRTHLVVLDCRAGRVLAPGQRSMLSEREWRWLEQELQRDCDHLLVAVSTPWLLVPGLHHLESWCEALADGAWGAAWVARAERVREALDLDHWAAFRRSFERLGELLRRAATGEAGRAPASILVLGGDVHSGSIAQVGFERAAALTSAVYQVVSSPLRNSMSRTQRFAAMLSRSRAAHLAGHALLASARLPRPGVRWRTAAGAWLDNHVSTLELRGRRARVRVERAADDAERAAHLEPVVDHALT